MARARKYVPPDSQVGNETVPEKVVCSVKNCCDPIVSCEENGYGFVGDEFGENRSPKENPSCR
jgi:hypothetical protein